MSYLHHGFKMQVIREQAQRSGLFSPGFSHLLSSRTAQLYPKKQVHVVPKFLRETERSQFPGLSDPQEWRFGGRRCDVKSEKTREAMMGALGDQGCGVAWRNPGLHACRSSRMHLQPRQALTPLSSPRTPETLKVWPKGLETPEKPAACPKAALGISGKKGKFSQVALELTSPV